MSAHTVSLDGYEVTREGRVFSNTNWRGYGRRELTQTPNQDGYPSVRVVLNGKRFRYPVHVLVAIAHLPVRASSSHQVRHLDGDKMNSSTENLAWGTAKENADDRERHGRTSRGDKHSCAVKEGMPAEPHNKGKPTSAEQKQKLSSAMKGVPWSAARRASSPRNTKEEMYV